MGRGLYLLLLISAATIQVFGQSWDEPYYLDPGNVHGVTLDPVDPGVVYFDEELPLFTRAVKLNYNGDVTPRLGQFLLPPNGEVFLGASFVKDEGFWFLEITTRQDFEATYFVGSPNYFFQIIIDSVSRDLNIIIINMDDNPPRMEPEVANCVIQEGPLEDFNVDELDCFYRIFDDDGHMANISQRITHAIHTNIEETFRFVANPVIPPGDITTNNMRMSLIPLEELDFETTSIYVLTWLVKDTNPEETVLRVVVEVTDIADTPPRWTSIFASRQFDEKEAQQFNVTAEDGDIVINDDITYMLIFPGQDWSDLISIDSDGIIDVQEINRDVLQIETYIFTIRACELNMPDQCVEQDITFLVNDLNDNAAIITVADDDFTLTLDESTVTTISTRIVVNDIDLGVNAQYTIELTSGSGVQYHEAFSVAPNSGYQETEVFLFITNPLRLDYEDLDWQHFSFNLVATGIENNTHVQSVTFEVNLNNLNDESPIFGLCNEHESTTLDECVVEILETFNGLTDLIAMEAKDGDIGDSVTHRLLGSYAQRILTINEDNGQITTANLARPFDYETLQEIIIQVQASDTLVDAYDTRNTAVSQLTIRLIDVNDETPMISVSSTLATMYENLKTGTEIMPDAEFNIVAMDDDTSADLYFEIDWDSSFAFKNGANIGEDFTDYIGCINIETIGSDGSPVTARLTIIETVPDNTPDYEKFDTLHLTVVAIDRNQEVGVDRTSVTIPILINDLNDNKPVFDESTITAEMTVRENSEAGTMIAVVTATDADIGTSLTYSLRPRDGTAEGLVSIVEGTGQLRVDGTQNIDADSPPLFNLYYTVTASDEDWTTDEDIVISVIDVNDNDPVFPATPVLQVPEKSDHGTHIHTFLATDDDRDEVNRAIVYRFRESTINLQFRSFFSIDETTGDFIVFYESDQELDRDQNIPASQNGLLNMEIVASNTDQLALSSFTEVTVVLIDINDQAPQLITETLTVSENSNAGASVGSIEASDGDDPETPNTHVTFKIINIEAIGRTFEDSLDDLFILEDINIEERTANLYVGRDLEGYYGDFRVTIEMEDFGEERQKNISYLIVTVAKYNFRPPTFVFPDPSDSMIYLSRTQNVDNILMIFGDNEQFPLLSATDNQGDKYILTFSIEHDLFRLAGTGGSILQISRQLSPADLNTIIPLTIAINSDGQPPLPVSAEFEIVFVDDTADPIFAINDASWVDEFVENTTQNQRKTFPEAKYELEGNLDIDFLPIHYVLQDPSLPFTIPDSTTAELHLDQALDRDTDDGCCYTVIIQAGKSASLTNPNDLKSLLTIHIELKDINDNPPNFDSENHYAMFHSDDTSSTVIYRMTATDIDRDSVIKYSIIGNPDLTNAQTFPGFGIDETNGAISLVGQPSSAATGYAILTVQASDGVFDTQDELKIFVISRTDHIVRFTFQNTRVECENKLNEIGEVLTAFFMERDYPYQASARGCLDVVNDAGEVIQGEVDAEVYFINTEENEPVRSAQIERFANDIPMFQALAREFLREDLNLISFSPTSEDEDNTVEVLRAWLIGVAVVLGALCVLLLVAFILKIRSLTNRLNKLSVTKYGSQDSGLNRKIVPNTNRNAVQGSNPVFNTEKTVPEFDQASIGSGDSDLVGVEDNPEFDYTPPKSNGVANPA